MRYEDSMCGKCEIRGKKASLKRVKMNIDNLPEEILEQILKEYAEDIFEEFQQIKRFEGKITLKDIADILQIN